MTLPNKNYNEFCQAFDLLVQIAHDNKKAHNYVFNLHNEITNGATQRIFEGGSLSLQDLKISELNFKRYIQQNDFDIFTLLSSINA